MAGLQSSETLNKSAKRAKASPRRGTTQESRLAPGLNSGHPIRLRLTAETCRRLLGAINDAETITRLTDLAEECEAKLSAMADRLSGEFKAPD